ncbi:integrase, catalytic region, zinc finger, CCHC-type containing protein [Tanacetum coccineum]
MNDRSYETYNAKDVTALIEQNECVRVELEKVKQHYKELYDSIKITYAHTSEKTSTMLNEIESLKAQLKSKVSCVTSDSVKPKVLAPDIYVIDVKPIPPPLKNNRSAHLNCINHLKESVETLREIVKEARVVKALDNALNYACQYTKLSQELLEYVIGTCPKSFNERDNKAPSTPLTRKKQVTFNDKPGTSSSNTQKHEEHQKVQHSISIPTGKKFSLGKLNCGYQWRPTGKKFILGEQCPLTKLLVKCRPLVSGKRLFKIYDGESFKAQELRRKVHQDRQFCDSDLEIAFRKHSCFVRDMNGVNLLKGNRSTNLYTISIDDIMKSSPICMLSKASKIKSWLWHHRLNHLNFGTINDLARKDLQIQVGLNKTVRYIRTDNGTEFVNQVMSKYYEGVGIFYQKSVPRTPQQNSVVERQNYTLVEAACTMLIFSKALMFLWAAAVATACYTHNRSLIHTHHNKTPYELVHDNKPDISFLRVFGAPWLSTNIAKSSSGPEPMSMTPGQFSSGLIPNQVHATTYVLPTDKDLELLFQPMFDEYFEVTRVDKPVPSAIAVNAQVVPSGTSVSTTFAQDAPSTSYSSSSSGIQPPVIHHDVPVRPTIEDTPITQATLHPSVNPVTREPGSAQL